MSLSFQPILHVLFMLASPWMANTVRPQDRRPSDDSANTRRYVERMQERFERTRWQHLPWTYGSSGRCDLRIGRYCFTFDDDDRHWTPPPDHPEVVIARDELVQTLDSVLAASSPADAWVLTQLVRYSTEAGRLELAKQAIASCALADPWVCHALAGYVHHMSQEYMLAEHAFDLALPLMNAEQRCEWEDVSDLLTGRLRGMWRDRDCTDRSGLRDTLFWLSDPLYLVPGNELRSEHFARHVVSMMYEQAKGPDFERWNSVTHEIVMRYGWPIGWQRQREYRTSLRPPVITHYGSRGSATFLPTSDMVNNPTAIPIGSWNIDPDRPQSSHSPPYALEAFEDLVVDLTMFRRGDSTIVISLASSSNEHVSPDDEIEFALAISSDPYHQLIVHSKNAIDTTHVLSATVAARPQLVSVEVLASKAGVAARTRFGRDFGRLHGPGLMISDLLVLDPIDSLPNNLAAAIPSIRQPNYYRAGERFVLYWELYGTQLDDLYSTSISLDKTSKGIFRRLAELTPLASHQPAVRVQWDDATRSVDHIATRSIAVDLPQQLSDGRYRLTLTIEASNGQRIERRIDFTVHTP